jgi:hypothetical protein
MGSADVARMKELFPGKLWALENSNIEHDKNGDEQKLRSPISMQEQILMTPMEKEIEEYLYHDKETLFSWVAIVIRRALMLAKCQWQHGLGNSSEPQSPPPSPLEENGAKLWEIEKFVDANENRSEFLVRWTGYTSKDDSWKKVADLPDGFDLRTFTEQYERDGPERIYFTRSGQDGTIDRNDLLEDHARLRGMRTTKEVKLVKVKGYARFEPARATNQATWGKKRTWWQQKGSCWPIFVYAGTMNTETLQNAAQTVAERLMLNPDIIEFAKKYKDEILSQPPLHTFEDIQRDCVERGLIKVDAVSDADDMHVSDEEQVAFDENSGRWLLSEDRQKLSQSRARGRPAGSVAAPGEKYKCSNCGQHGHNKRSCPIASSGGQAVEAAQNTGKRKQGTPSGSSRSPKASRQNVSSPTSCSSSDEDFPTPRKIDFESPRKIEYGGSAPAQQLPASTGRSFRAGDIGASGDAQDSCKQCKKSMSRCKCTCIVID